MNINTWRWANFTIEEMRCKGTGLCEMDPYFMDSLQALRVACGFPFPVTSGFRAEEYDDSIGGAGVHPTGKAVDLQIYGHRVFEVVKLAAKFGFTGIGLSQKGDYSRRFIHLDTLPVGGSGHPRPWIWTY